MLFERLDPLDLDVGRNRVIVFEPSAKSVPTRGVDFFEFQFFRLDFFIGSLHLMSAVIVQPKFPKNRFRSFISFRI